MESEIHKRSSRIVLLSRKKREIKDRDRISLDRSIKQVSSLKLNSILENSCSEYKKDLEIITSGYLNHNNLLKVYKDENEKLLDLLEEYDVVRNRNQIKFSGASTACIIDKESSNSSSKRVHVPIILPNQYLNVTKADRFKTFKMIDQSVVERDLFHLKGAIKPKTDQLQQHLQFIQEELKDKDLQSLDKLQVYSRCFENIISEFKTFGPLLAKIKKVYDDTISSFTSDQDELGFLRNKVQHLLAKNENRLLLKLERKKAYRLQEEIIALKDEQKTLKEESFRKLAIYSAYIPEHLLKDKLDDQNELLQESISKIRSLIENGMDPLSCLESQVIGLKQEVLEKNETIQELKSSISKDYVSKASKDLVDESLIEVKEKLGKVVQVNREQELTLKNLLLELENLKSVLKDKEIQYESLSKEYSELSEAAAISFDKLLAKNKD